MCARRRMITKADRMLDMIYTIGRIDMINPRISIGCDNNQNAAPATMNESAAHGMKTRDGWTISSVAAIE